MSEPKKCPPEFTAEQLAYLIDCSQEAYSARWKIGKDAMWVIEEFMVYFAKQALLNKDFSEALQEEDEAGERLHPF